MGVIFVGAAISGFIGLIIGSAKGYGGVGFFLGLFLGPIGWIIAATMAPTPEIAARRQIEIEAIRASIASGEQPERRPRPANTWDRR